MWFEKAIRSARHHKNIVNDENCILKVIYHHQFEYVSFEIKGEIYKELKNTNLAAYNRLCFEILETLKVYSDKWEILDD